MQVIGLTKHPQALQQGWYNSLKHTFSQNWPELMCVHRHLFTTIPSVPCPLNPLGDPPVLPSGHQHCFQWSKESRKVWRTCKTSIILSYPDSSTTPTATNLQNSNHTLLSGHQLTIIQMTREGHYWAYSENCHTFSNCMHTLPSNCAHIEQKHVTMEFCHWVLLFKGPNHLTRHIYSLKRHRGYLEVSFLTSASLCPIWSLCPWDSSSASSLYCSSSSSSTSTFLKLDSPVFLDMATRFFLALEKGYEALQVFLDDGQI